jgi:hypothetical protein
MKTMGRERGPLTRQSGPQHGSKCPTMNPRSGSPKPSPNPSRAAGASPGKMDTQDASGLRFGPSTAHGKLTKRSTSSQKMGMRGPSQGTGALGGVPAPPQMPNGTDLRMPTTTTSPMSVVGCTARFSVPGRQNEVGLEE